jgi:hypothetical protein
MCAISVFRWTGYGTCRIRNSHNGGYDEFYLLDPEAGGDMLLRNVGELHGVGVLTTVVMMSFIFPTLKMEAICYSETSVDCQLTARH